MLISYGLGFMMGVDTTIKRAVKILPIFTNITINEQHIHDALFRYNNNIGGCFP